MSLAVSARGRFWFTIFVFALANLGAWLWFLTGYAPAQKNLLRVEQCSVALGSPQVPQNIPAIELEFNAPVQPRRTGLAPAVFQPDIRGTWSQTNTLNWTFRPDAPLPKATEYRMTIPAERLLNTDGLRLREDFVRTFRTQPLTVRNVRQVDFQANDRLLIEAEFDDVVSPSEALEFMNVYTHTDGNNNSRQQSVLNLSTWSNTAGSSLRFLTAPLTDLRRNDMNLMVAFKPGLRGNAGPLGLTSQREFSVPISRTLCVESLEYQHESASTFNIRVNCNREVSPEALKQVLTIDPPVEFTTSRYYYNNAIMVHGNFKPATRYVFTIAPAPVTAGDKYPRATTLAITTPDLTTRLWFEYARGYMGTQGNRTVVLKSTNATQAKVKLHRVHENNMLWWLNCSSYSQASDVGKPLGEKIIKLGNTRNEAQEYKIALDELAREPLNGVYCLSVTRAENESEISLRDDQEYYGAGDHMLVTFSDIGLSSRWSDTSVTIWATSLKTAQPMNQIPVRVYSQKYQLLGEGQTNTEGLVTITKLRQIPDEEPAFLVASRTDGTDLTWLDMRSSNLSPLDGGGQIGGDTYLRKGYDAFVFTSRDMFRPGETIPVSAVVRGPGYDTDAAPQQAFPVEWQLVNPANRIITRVTQMVQPGGWTQWQCPMTADLPTGRWSLRVVLPGSEKQLGETQVRVEEFMPERMQVKLALNDTEGKPVAEYWTGQKPLSAQVQSDYLFGQPAAELTANANVRIMTRSYPGAAWENWQIGDTANVASIKHKPSNPGQVQELDKQRTDDQGQAVFALLPEKLLPKVDTKDPWAYRGPLQMVVQASVLESGGRAVTATQSLPVLRESMYLALKNVSQKLTKVGHEARFDLRQARPDGTAEAWPATPPVQLELYAERWDSNVVYQNNTYRYVSTRKLDLIENAPCKLETTSTGLQIVTRPPATGNYVLVARWQPTGVYSSAPFYVGADQDWSDSITREDPEGLKVTFTNAADWTGQLLPTYDLGAVPEVMIRSPFAGTLLLTVETDHVLWSQVVTMKESVTTIKLPAIDATWRPNVHISAAVVRGIDPEVKWRVHRALGGAGLAVAPGTHALKVKLTAPAELRPQRELKVSADVLQANDRPAAGAQVMVMAVDEGILALSKFESPDPLAYFHRPRRRGTSWSDLYSQLLPEVARPTVTSNTGGGGDSDEAEQYFSAGARYISPMQARRVRPVALATSLLTADAEGHIEGTMMVPQFSGQLRVMLVATTAYQYGHTQGPVLIKQPLMIQATAPRFAAPGDSFTLPLRLFNNTDQAGEVNWKVAVVNPTDAPTLAQVTVPANTKLNVTPRQQCELAAQVQIGAGIGVIKLVFTAEGLDDSYREEIELPIRPAAPMLTLGGSQTVAGGRNLELAVPTELVAGNRTFQIMISPRPKLNIPAGLSYLNHYPYGCAEQTISATLPLLYLKDLAAEIDPLLLDSASIDSNVKAGLLRLASMQRPDGGIGMWQRDDSWPWASIYAAHLMVEADNAGYKIDPDFKRNLVEYLRRQVLREINPEEDWSAHQAYACWVLARLGLPDRAMVSRLADVLTERRKSNTITASDSTAECYIAATYLLLGQREKAQLWLPRDLPAVDQPRSQSGSLSSPSRDLAILVSTLIDVNPTDPRIANLTQRIGQAQGRYAWYCTQDRAMGLIAMGKYLRLVKNQKPYTSAELWVNEQRVAVTFDGKPLHHRFTQWPADQRINIKTEGAADAVAHVGWLANGVPLKPPADQDSGLKVRREFLDRTGKPVDLTKLQRGQEIWIRLTTHSLNNIANVAIEDLLPAGLEIEQTFTTASTDTPSDLARDGYAALGQRTDKRDDRMVLFGGVPAGYGQYVYQVRAVTPGTYFAGPVRAEAMYDAAITSSHGSETKVVIQAEP